MKSNKKWLAVGRKVLAWLLVASMAAGNLPASVARAAELPKTELTDVSAGDDSVVTSDDVVVDDVESTVSSNDTVADDLAADVSDGDSAAKTMSTETEEDISAEFLATEKAGENTSLVPVIKVDTDSLSKLVENQTGVVYNYITGKAEANYQKTNPVYGDVLAAKIKNAVTVELGATTSSYLKSKLTYAWKNAAGAVVSEPDTVGEYKLVASLAAQENYCVAAADVEVLTLVVKQAEIKLHVDNTFDPGDTVQYVIDQNAGYTVYVVDVNGNEVEVARDEYATVTFEVYKAYPTGTDGGYTYTKLAATDVLQGKEDYRLEAIVTLKDIVNYVVKEDKFNIKLGPQIPTWIEIDGAAKGKTYDGEPLVGYTGTAEAPVDFTTAGEKGFTAKVFYRDEKTDEKKEVPGKEAGKPAEIKGTWYIDSKVMGEADHLVKIGDENFAPVDAGVYYYVLTYEDENGTYANASSAEDKNNKDGLNVRVEIKPAQIVVVPEIAVDAENPVYDGTSVSSVLRRVDYKVYAVNNGVRSADPMKVDEYFWGSAYSTDNREQYYAPVFQVERGLKDAQGNVATWANYTGKIVLEETVTEKDANGNDQEKKLQYGYRVVFSGLKGIFDKNGSTYDNDEGESTRVDINFSQKNYTVDTTLVTKENDAKVFTPIPSTEVVISVAPILELHDNKGATLENAFVKEYDGEEFYQNRGAYKIATVTPSEAASSLSLVYRWEVADLYRSLNVDGDETQDDILKVDKDGKLIYELLDWTNYGSYNNNVEDYAVPKEPGIYRLKVSLGTSGKYHAEDAYVYYVIQPQNTLVELTGTLSVYADGITTAGDLLESLQTKDKEQTDTYVELNVYPVTVSDAGVATKVGAEGEAAEGEAAEAVSSPIEKLIKYYFEEYRDTYFRVEKEVAVVGWVKCADNEILENGVKYRVIFNSEAYNQTDRRKIDTYIDADKKETEYILYDSRYYDDDTESLKFRSHSYLAAVGDIAKPVSVSDFYNFGQKIDAINHIVSFKFYENVPVAVEAKQSAATEVEISVDETKLTGNVKTYDGKPFDLTNLQNLIKVTKTADGSDVSETVKPMLKIQFVHSLEFWDEFMDDNAYEIWYDLMGKSVDASKAIHADNYIVKISLAANADYKQADLTLDTRYVIERKKVNVKVTPKDEIRAGKQVQYPADQFVADYILASDNILNCCTFEIDGEAVTVVPAEEGATGIDETDVSKIVGKPYNWLVHRSIDDETYGDRYTGYLKSSETYYAIATSFEYGLRQDANYLNGWIDYRVDYEAVCEKVVFTPKRAAASVTERNVPLKDDVSHDATLDQFTHTITARASVPFVDGNTVSGDKGAKEGEGNFFRFRLWVPGEFRGDKQFAEDTKEGSYRDSIFFKNSIENIEKSGGVVINTENNYIDVQYDAAMGGQPTFDVLWAKDYVETYVVNLAGMTLDVDLRKAVEPKSLSFSGAAKTMYVGETQQLDVKLKKNQMSDIILLGYRSDNEDVLRVSEDGFVTALTKGSATIEVFPCVMVNGKKKVKTAKVKITVKDVSKTKVTKIKAGDTYAEVTYNAPADGYRREAYVLAGKAKESEFELKIAAVKNGDYSAFVAVDLNISGAEKAAGTKGAKTGAFTIPGLKAGKNEYTVYVRNVSGLRELEDGGQVAVSSAGSVKTFKTTAPEIAGLNIRFDSTITVETTEAYGTQYVAQFASKSTKLGVQAKLWQRYLVDYADGGDFVWRDLPLGASEKKIFMVPKLQYFVSDNAYYYENLGGRYYNPDKGRYTERGNLSAKVREIINNYSENNYSECELYGNMVFYKGYWYDKTSVVAKVDKSGKITFTGVTDLDQPIYVLVTDTVSKEADVEELIIKASPDNLTAKSVKLQPGQGIWLRDYLDYKQKNAKVVNYGKYFRDLSINAESNDQFKINYVADAHDNHTVQGGDYWIQAIAPGSLEINVTDNTVGKSAKMKITCAALESVKNLKVQAAYDDKFRITFSYPRKDVQFKYEFKTASGKVIKTEITNSYGEWDAKAKKYVYTVNFGDPDVIGNWVDWMYRSYDALDLGFANTTIDTTMENRRNRINMLSNYTVTVTALDGDQMSKPVNLKVKTTNIPASYHDIVAENLVWYDRDSRGNVIYDGGENIRVSESGAGLQNDGSFLFKSGNIYTLTMSGGGRYNTVAQRRMSDTLVWKSYDNKVASVKANTGSYSAKLTAVRPGKTVIEVSSKLTKKVIARHTIVVCAVGDAHVYYADNEPYNRYDEEFLDYRPTTDRDILESTLNKAIDITLQPGERQWFVFTAPAIGYYTVVWGPKNSNNPNTHYEAMEKGTTRYFSVANTTNTAKPYQVKVIAGNNDIYTTEVVLGDNPAGSGQSYYFIAPEDNTYTIEFVDKADPNKKSPNKLVRAFKKGEIWTLSNLTQPTLGKEFILKITKRELAGALSLTTDTNVALNNKDEVKWYSFTAEESNSYTFTITPAEAAIGAKQLKIGYYTNLREAENGDILWGFAAEAKREQTIKKGETVYIGISSADAAADSIVNAVIKVSKRDAGEAISVGTKEGITFAENGEKWFEFTAPSAGIYQFTATGTKKAKTEGAKDDPASLLMQSYTELDGDAAKDGDLDTTSYMKAGDKIYVRLSENSGNNDPDTTVTAKIVIEKVSIDFTGILEIKVPAKGSKQITWNPKNAGRYDIAMSTTAEKVHADNLSGNVDGERFTTTDPVKGRYVTNRNKSISIYNTNDVEVTVTVTVSDFAVDKVEIGKDYPITLTANGEQWFKFIPEEDNSYVFSFAPNEASKTAGYTVDLEFYEGIDSNYPIYGLDMTLGVQDVEGQNITGGDTYFIKITPPQTLADNTSVVGNFKITKRAFTGVLPMSGTSVTLGSSIEKRYEFTAPEHGFYTFSAEGSKVLAAGAEPVAAKVRLAKYSSLTSNSSSASDGYRNKVSLPTVELDAGEHYILAVSSNEAFATQAVTAKISVKKETMFSIGSINITVPKKSEDGTAGSALVYWFPRSTWRYNITMSTSAENADTDLDATVYGENNNYYDLKAAPITGLYAKERTGYPVYLTNSGDKDIAVTINVSLLKTDRLTTAETGNNVKGNKNIPGWYEFTAPKTADYVFKVTLDDATKKFDTTIYTELSATTGSTIDGAREVAVALKEDQTIYIKVTTNYSTTDNEGKLLTPDVTGNIKISEYVYTDVLKAGDPGTNVDFTKANTDARRCVFVAEEDGLYTFTWAARETGKPFDVIVSGDIWRYGQVKYLVKGQRVKFTMSPNGTPEENAPYAGCIKVTKRDSVAGNLQVGSTAAVTLANDSYVWYAFTATKDNMYEISFEPKEGGSAAVIDTVEYYSEEKSEYSESWRYRFPETLSLDKDKKIYFRLRASGATADNKAEYVFKVTERTEAGILEDAKESSIIATNVTGDVDGNWYKFVPTLGNYKYKVTIQPDNEGTTIYMERYSSLQDTEYRTYSSDLGTYEIRFNGEDKDGDGVVDNAYYFRATSYNATETTSVTGKVTIQLVPEFVQID